MTFFQKKLNDWNIDNNFIDNVISKSALYNLITFDIFDTAITRDVESPADIFAKVEKKLNEKKYTWEGFANFREEAEAATRKNLFIKNGFGEIKFDEIYDHILAHAAEKKDLVPLAKTLELEIEAQSLYAVPDILHLVNILNEKKIPYAFVSDMYLSEDFLTDLLNNLGFKNWQNLIVSSTLRMTKSQGNIWLDKRLHKKKILHIGDNFHSDVTEPNKYGIDTIYYDRALCDIRTGDKLSPSVLAFSEQRRLTNIITRKDPNYKNLPDIDQITMRSLGESLGALMLGTFINWLGERAKKNNIDHLYFCARDGWLMREAWHLLELGKKYNITDSYLHVSRKVLTLGCGYLDSRPDFIPEYIVDFLCARQRAVPLSQALKDFDLTSPAIMEHACKAFGNLDVPISWRDNYEKFKSFIRDNSNNVYLILEKNYHDIIAYFNQQNISKNTNVGIVDLGWNGTMQRSITKLQRSVQKDFNCVGFYYGLWAAASGNRYLSGPMESAFFNEFESQADFFIKTQGVDSIEELHSSSEGTTTGYEEIDGVFQPKCTPSEIETYQYSNFIKPFQEGALHALKQIKENGFYERLDESLFSHENAISAYYQVFISPNNEEVNALTKIAHGGSFDHNLKAISGTNIPKNTTSEEQLFGEHGWWVGLLRYWQINSETKEEKIKFINTAKNKLNLAPKQLRIFERI